MSKKPTSNGCRDARSSVRCVKGYGVRALTGTDARPCVPTFRYSSRFDEDGRTTVRPYSRYSSRFDGDGRTTVRPYTGLLVSL